MNYPIILLFFWLTFGHSIFDLQGQSTKRLNDSQLVQRFKRNGKPLHSDRGSSVFQYVRDSIHYKMLIKNDQLIYSSSQDVSSNSSSWAKFSNNCLVFYDSLDAAGKHVISYIKGMQAFENTSNLPYELKEFVCE
jgi:hypothetical protein